MGKMCRIMVIFLMAMMSSSSSVLGDSRSIVERLKPNSNDQDNKSPMKKAYTYVSEYKRLPYSFGIGKRWAGNGVKGAQPYSFGFGKRSASVDLYPMRMGMDFAPYDNYDNYVNDVMAKNSKLSTKRGGRVRQFDFGLGKRSIPAEFNDRSLNLNHEDIEEMKKQQQEETINDEIAQRYFYGLNNRFVNDQDDLQEDD